MGTAVDHARDRRQGACHQDSRAHARDDGTGGAIDRLLEAELGRAATVDELAVRAEISRENVLLIRFHRQNVTSLDLPVGDGATSLGDLVPDPRSSVVERAAERAMLTEALEEALEELNDRDRAVIRLRFGLDDGKPRTLEEVGQEFGVTRERIRQIESKTLGKLRHPTRSMRLQEFLED